MRLPLPPRLLAVLLVLVPLCARARGIDDMMEWSAMFPAGAGLVGGVVTGLLRTGAGKGLLLSAAGFCVFVGFYADASIPLLLWFSVIFGTVPALAAYGIGRWCAGRLRPRPAQEEAAASGADAVAPAPRAGERKPSG